MMCSEAVYAVEGSDEAGAELKEAGNVLVGSPFIGAVTSQRVTLNSSSAIRRS